MNTIAIITEPIGDLFRYFVDDPIIKEKEKFKGGTSVGSEWHTKIYQSNIDRILKEIYSFKRKFYDEPLLSDVIKDNIYRLTLLAGLERVFVIRQAQPSLKFRASIPEGNTQVLQSLFNNGTFKGYFRGYWVNLTHFIATQYHALLYSYNTSMLQHFLISSLIETTAYPLDTIRTLIYCDMGRNYKGYFHCLKSVLDTNGWQHLFRGVQFKLTYNAAFLWNLRNLYDENLLLCVSLPIWMASYILLTIKTRLQVYDTSLSFYQAKNDNAFKYTFLNSFKISSPYNGVIPFTLINLLFSYTFYSLYSQSKKDDLINGCHKRIEDLGFSHKN